MIYTYRNFISTFLQMNTWWYIDTVTFYQLSYTRTRDDIYIPQLYINFLADEPLMRSTYCNFISTLLQMNTWWYIHTVTLYQLSCTRTRDDIYTETLYEFCCRWTRGNIYRFQRFFNFPADEQVLIYSCGKFISFFVRWRRDDRYFCRSFISTFL